MLNFFVQFIIHDNYICIFIFFFFLPPCPRRVISLSVITQCLAVKFLICTLFVNTFFSCVEVHASRAHGGYTFAGFFLN